MRKITPFLISILLVFSIKSYAAEVILTPTSSQLNPAVTTSYSYNQNTSSQVFTRNLSVGSYGKDVMALKKIINLELGTPLDSGATFTTNTTADVKKLQEKYAVDVLIPVGLSSGTGFVGPSTTSKLNQLAQKYYITLDSFTLPAVSTEKTYFTTTLQLGSSGDEVSLLKIVLNSDSDTKISSSQNSTNSIFDVATEDAVNRFQEKYASEILAPSGLTHGIGIVGPSTRKKLNSLLNNILLSVQVSNASTTGSFSSVYPYSYPSVNKTSAATSSLETNPTFSGTSNSGNLSTTNVCANLNADVQYGQQDSGNNKNVYILQNFLNKNGYLKVSPTGYFGSLTIAAVKAFQSANNLNPTGYVDSITRNLIQNIDCNYTKIISSGTSSGVTGTTPVSPNQTGSITTTPVITLTAASIQVSAGEPTTLTWNSTNAVGQCKITAKDSAGNNLSSNIDSSGKKSTGPINNTTTYTVICYNNYGVPGSKSITVQVVDQTQIKNQQQTSYPGAATINSLVPSSGNRGDLVTIYGSGFLSTNDIFFDGSKIDSGLVLSQSSTSILFKVPEYKSCLTSYCPPPAVSTTIETGGPKTVQVSNTNGFSNDYTFTLPSNKITIAGTSNITPYAPPKLAINYILPTSGNRGDIATIYGSGFSSDSTVFFGGFMVANNLILSKNSTSISFMIPPFQMGCTNPDYETCPRLPLPGSGLIIETGGTKDVYVMNTSSRATTTSVTFTLPSKKIVY